MIAMSTSFSSSSSSLSSSSSSSSLSSTRLFTSKSPLRGPRTLETVSQYSFHIVNAAVTGLRTSARLFTGDLIPPRSALIFAAFFFPKIVIIYARRKHRHLLSHLPPPSSPLEAFSITLYPARFLNSTLASVYCLSLHISFGTGDRTPRISLLPSWQSCR